MHLFTTSRKFSIDLWGKVLTSSKRLRILFRFYRLRRRGKRSHLFILRIDRIKFKKVKRRLTRFGRLRHDHRRFLATTVSTRRNLHFYSGARLNYSLAFDIAFGNILRDDFLLFYTD